MKPDRKYVVQKAILYYLDGGLLTPDYQNDFDSLIKERMELSCSDSGKRPPLIKLNKRASVALLFFLINILQITST